MGAVIRYNACAWHGSNVVMNHAYVLAGQDAWLNIRLLPEARAMAKFLPLDTISLRYVAWEMLVEVRSTGQHPEPAHTL